MRSKSAAICWSTDGRIFSVAYGHEETPADRGDATLQEWFMAMDGGWRGVGMILVAIVFLVPS